MKFFVDTTCHAHGMEKQDNPSWNSQTEKKHKSAVLYDLWWRLCVWSNDTLPWNDTDTDVIVITLLYCLTYMICYDMKWIFYLQKAGVDERREREKGRIFQRKNGEKTSHVKLGLNYYCHGTPHLAHWFNNFVPSTSGGFVVKVIKKELVLLACSSVVK